MSEHDRELSRLYRQASVETPHAALDAAILKAARDKLARPAKLTKPARARWSRWSAAAGLMATLVLAVSVTLMVERERPITGERTVERSEARAPADARVDDAARSAPPAAMVAPPAQRLKERAAAQSARAQRSASVEEPASRAPIATLPSAADLTVGREQAAPTASLLGKGAPETPEARLEEIRRLKRDGFDQEVVVRLEAFRKEFPDYPVPKDLAP